MYDRVRKGLRIVEERGRIQKIEQHIVDYEVKGDTDTYTVRYTPEFDDYTCTCPDHQMARNTCKHIWGVRFYREGR